MQSDTDKRAAAIAALGCYDHSSRNKNMFKPLLAGKAPEDLSKLIYPLLASPKLDGIRCVKVDGQALSRHLKPIPNRFVREWVERWLPDGIDGELTLIDYTRPFREVTSAIMSRDGEPDFAFRAFDWTQGNGWGFSDRLEDLRRWRTAIAGLEGLNIESRLVIVGHDTVTNPQQLEELISRHAQEGYEGTMVRSPTGRYKYGRSTTKEGILLKIKAFADEEAVVVGVIEEMENCNEPVLNAVGHTERSAKKEGMRRKGRAGKLVCRFLEDGVEFAVGSGLTDDDKWRFWPGAQIIGQVVKIKHQPSPGGRKLGEAPRFPVYLGIRHEID